MLRLDRYLVSRSSAVDLASGNAVAIERVGARRAPAMLFHTHQGRTLIDVEPNATGRLEIWEPWTVRSHPPRLSAQVIDFAEALESARLGAPRSFDLSTSGSTNTEYITRVLAREARVRGWVPISAELLGALWRGCQPGATWLEDRSLVIFAEIPGLSGDAVLALLRLAQRDRRPHLVVRMPMQRSGGRRWPSGRTLPTPTVHERSGKFGESASAGAANPNEEANARWMILIEELTAGCARPERVVALAQVLASLGQDFEARALLERIPDGSAAQADRDAALSALAALAENRARQSLGAGGGAGSKSWEMVDDCVGLLQMCQDIEDERVALSRVGAFLRERLQASTVAFVAREGKTPRVVARVGSDQATIDLAMRSIETGAAIRPARSLGPVESACPVRHAAEVIGAVWCRWSAGVPVAGQHAVSLLGLAAAATAPSLRLAIATSLQTTGAASEVPELVGESRAMAAVRDAIVRAAASPFPVVIEGESGSGKELAARAIHSRSARRDRRFCALNCAALVDDLLEAELFGHVRGAFTGAIADRAGLFEEASGGTLFLDEVADLGSRAQAKLLRTLQEHEVRRIGETIVRKIDVRLVAATNRPLAQAVAAGAFRADLWYRLDVVRITLPPLRERIEDLPLLVSHLWAALSARTGSRAALSEAAVAALAGYDWPGNIRELQNVLASMLVRSRGGLIGPSALPAHVARVASLERGATLADARRHFEERYVRAALARAGGRTSVAARHLGLTRQGLSKLMGRLGIAATIGERAQQAHIQ